MALGSLPGRPDASEALCTRPVVGGTSSLSAQVQPVPRANTNLVAIMLDEIMADRL